MPRKKKEVEETQTETAETQATEETASASNTDTPENSDVQAAGEGANAENSESSSIIGSVFETVSSVVGGVAEAVVGGVSSVVSAVAGSSTEVTKKPTRKRAERIGVVASDKMTKTVTVRVDRRVKHPVYRKYVKSRKKFMAHDETGATVGDKVRIVETRPLSARKRWRVVEIIQKAEK